MYRIGQFRRSQMVEDFFTKFEENTDYMAEELVTKAQNSSIEFNDYHVIQKNTGDEQNMLFNNQNYYYIHFAIQQNEESSQEFFIKLHNTNILEEDESSQFIERIFVDKGSLTTNFELIIAPNANYDEIIFEMARGTDDYRTINEKGTSGRITRMSIQTIGKIKNIIDILKNNGNYSNLKNLSKIGIQGPPSLLMCINGEQIRIGKSGIYELNNGIKVTFIGFIPRDSVDPQKPIDYFIMDFEY